MAWRGEPERGGGRSYEQRNHKFASFEKAIHYSADMAAYLHVASAWQAAESGADPNSDAINQSILNAAAVVRRLLRAKLGTDLTIHSDINPWYVTGNAVKVKKSENLKHQPWKHQWNVADKKAVGKGRMNTEHWSAYVQRWITDSCFPYWYGTA